MQEHMSKIPEAYLTCVERCGCMVWPGGKICIQLDTKDNILVSGQNYMFRHLTKNSVGVFEYVDYDKECPESSILLQYQDTA